MIPKGGKVTQKAGVGGNSGVQWGRAEALQSDRSILTSQITLHKLLNLCNMFHNHIFLLTTLQPLLLLISLPHFLSLADSRWSVVSWKENLAPIQPKATESVIQLTIICQV